LSWSYSFIALVKFYRFERGEVTGLHLSAMNAINLKAIFPISRGLYHKPLSAVNGSERFVRSAWSRTRIRACGKRLLRKAVAAQVVRRAPHRMLLE